MQEKRFELDFVRATACVMILFYHLSGYWNDYDGHGIWGWCNIGVQTFFFLSGYLAASGKKDFNLQWITQKLKRIMIPYWIYLTIVIPAIFLMDNLQINIPKVFLAYSGLMGFFWEYRIESIGVLWFVSYIMLCYIFTPFVNRYYNKACNYLAIKKSPGGQTISLVVAVMLMAFILQIVTIPLALAFKFKSAWISLYMFAFFYAKLCDTNKEVERLNKVILMISAIGVLIRIWTNDIQVAGLMENVVDLCIQYITCVQGAAIFIIIRRVCMEFKIFQQKRSRKIVLYICGISYEIYIVQGFFCDGIFTSELCGNYVMNSVVILALVLLSANALSHLRIVMAKLADKWRN